MAYLQGDKLPYYVTEISDKYKLTPLMALVWGQMSEDEFVEKVAQEVWKAPLMSRRGYKLRIGRVGCSTHKSYKFVSILGKHYPAKKKRELSNRVYARGNALLRAACIDWVKTVIETCDLDVLLIQDAVSQVVPNGGRNEVRSILSTALEANKEGILKFLDSYRSCIPE